jgi:hypothetical protein
MYALLSPRPPPAIETSELREMRHGVDRTVTHSQTQHTKPVHSTQCSYKPLVIMKRHEDSAGPQRTERSSAVSVVAPGRFVGHKNLVAPSAALGQPAEH